MLLEQHRHVFLTSYPIIFYPNPATFQLETLGKLFTSSCLNFFIYNMRMMILFGLNELIHTESM